MGSHYLDHAATTPMLEEAREAYLEESMRGGNPSSLHGSGRRARAVVEEAREQVAEALGAQPAEVIWTSGGTEADNVAVKGMYWGRRDADASRTTVVTTSVEHHAVLDPVRWLATYQGARAVELPVDLEGRLRLDALDDMLWTTAPSVAFISAMWANNEVGTVQPVAEVVARAAAHGIPVHSDAVQAIGKVPVHFGQSGLTAMTVSAHKVGGPVGVGVLVARRDAPLQALTHGGGQERSVRSGTVDTAGARASAIAISGAVADRVAETARLAALQQSLRDRISTELPQARLSGPPPGPDLLAGHVHITVPGTRGEALLFTLDSHGVEVSNGSACTAGVVQSSHVLEAMGRDATEASATLRFSLGRTTTSADVDALMAVLPEAVARGQVVPSERRQT